MTKTFEEVPVATVEVIPTFDGNEIKFKPLSKLENYLIAEGEVELYLRTQHQPLPEVPEFVAKWYEDNKNDLEFSLHKIAISMYNNTHHDEVELWFCDMRNKPIETLIRMKDGYTVQKPKRFYLKNKLTTSYLELDKTNDYFHHTMNPAPYYDMTRKSQFTQEETDSMQTGSYEQIEVAE